MRKIDSLSMLQLIFQKIFQQGRTKRRYYIRKTVVNDNNCVSKKASFILQTHLA